MFSIFKRKPKIQDDDLMHLVSSGVPIALQGVKEHWSLGEKAKGDELLDAMLQVVTQRLIGPESVKFAAFCQVLGFLGDNGEHQRMLALLNVAKRRASDFEEKQLQFILGSIDKLEANSQISPNAQKLYYVCHSCGHARLLLSQHCVHCGNLLASRDEVALARALCVDLVPPSTLHRLARQIEADSREKPRKHFTEEYVKPLRGEGLKTDFGRAFNASVDAIWDLLKDGDRQRPAPPNIKFNCLECGESNSVGFHIRGGKCKKCGVVLPIPALRLVKTHLYFLMRFMMFAIVPDDRLDFKNLIGEIVDMEFHAVVKDAMPPAATGKRLVDRFNRLGNLYVYDATCQISFQDKKAIISSTNPSAQVAERMSYIASSVAALNELLDIICSDELQV